MKNLKIKKLEGILKIFKNSVYSCEVKKNEKGTLKEIEIIYDGGLYKKEFDSLKAFIANLKGLGRLEKKSGFGFWCSWCGHQCSGTYLFHQKYQEPIKIRFESLKDCYCPE